jgi:hypothetical protein
MMFFQTQYFHIQLRDFPVLKWFQNKFLQSYLNYFHIHFFQLIQIPSLSASRQRDRETMILKMVRCKLENNVLLYPDWGSTISLKHLPPNA